MNFQEMIIKQDKLLQRLGLTEPSKKPVQIDLCPCPIQTRFNMAYFQSNPVTRENNSDVEIKYDDIRKFTWADISNESYKFDN